MNKDQFKGKVDQLKGQIKEATGKLFGNQRLENEGKAQNAAGDTQEKAGDIKEDIKTGP
ncbi:CsbD-like protein [compost metagenome]